MIQILINNWIFKYRNFCYSSFSWRKKKNTGKIITPNILKFSFKDIDSKLILNLLIGQSVHEHFVHPKDTPTRSDEAHASAVVREDVLLTSEEQLVQNILDKGKNKTSVRIRKL